MEVRKVQETGKGTLFITLPKDWCRRYSISKKAILDVEVKEDGLLLVYPFKREQLTSRISILHEQSKLSDTTNNIIGGYLLGYTLIEIISKNSLGIEEREKIRETSSKLVGMEILEETYNRMNIKFILDPSELSPDLIFSRMSFISKNMILDIGNALELSFNKAILASIKKSEDELDRQYLLLIRLLRTALVHPKLSIQYKISSVEVMDRRMAAYFIEMVGDLTHDLAEEITEQMPQELPENGIHFIKNTIGDVIEIYERAISAVLKKDRKYVQGIGNQYERIQEILLQMPQSSRFLHLFADYVLEVAKAALDIADLVASLYQM